VEAALTAPTKTSPTKRGLKPIQTSGDGGATWADENFPDEEGTETCRLGSVVDRLKVFHASDENNSNMNAKDAISAHVNWKLRIHSLLSGKLAEKLDPQAIEKDNMCDLGKWLYSDGRTQLAKQKHEELMAAHTQFHREAARIVRENYEGHKIGLEAIEMDSPFGRLTTKIVGILSSTANKP
jgi:hypothetical protein